MQRSLLATILFAFAGSIAAAAQAPDTVLLHGKIWTGNAQQPEAEAIAIARDRISAVGTSADIAKLAAANTRIIDLHGSRVVPGFNDAHTHFFEGGKSLTSVQLRNANSPQELRDRIAAYAKSIPKGEWIVNGEWDHENWTPAALPTHQLIDAVTPDNPVFVSRLDGHMALANAFAMQLAGVSRDTPDVPGGVIVRDSQGNPTGIFKDKARELIDHKIPLATPAMLERELQAAEKYAAENGVTSVQIMWEGEPPQLIAEELRVLSDKERSGALTTRIELSNGLAYWKLPAAIGITAPFGDTMLRIGGLKDFADGSLGSTTAWLLAPYVDAPLTSGVPRPRLTDPNGIYADAKAADLAGLQVEVHAIGDAANRTMLDIYQRIEQEDGPRDRRFRIEHAQHLTAQDIPRFAQLHVIASMQPLHLYDDGRWAEKRIGPDRVKFAYAFRSLLDSGAVLAFGSDWPVAPMKPLEGIRAAVTRQTSDGRHPDGWIPGQKISAAEALRAYTWASAYAEFQELEKGTLAPGMLADIVVLDTDILRADADDLAHAHVDMTILAGKVIYQRQP